MLTLQGLTVRYGETVAVDSADLAVPEGSIAALLGPSGCGKSTLLAAIAGIEKPAAGEICWDGIDLADVPIQHRGFGLMFRDGVLFPHRTVAGNVGYGLRGPARKRDARVAELLELVGLPGFGPRPVATLSGGQAQRVALARALAPRPRLLLLDEPLASLDRQLRDHLLIDLSRALRDTGTTALFVTHDQAEAFAVADSLAVMRAGRIVQVGAPGEVWRRPVDEETARFLGCTAILAAGDPLAGVLYDAPLGPGRIGLRPSALVADPAGPLRGVVSAAVPGPERTRLTVRNLARDAAGAPDPGAGPVSDTALPALAPSGNYVEGDIVSLRVDEAQLALIDLAEGDRHTRR